MSKRVPVLALSAPLVAFASVSAAAAAPLEHRIAVEVVGAVAHVEVERVLPASDSRRGEPPLEGLLELALPAGAAPLHWQLGTARGEVTRSPRPRDAYAQAWRQHLALPATAELPARPRRDAAGADEGAQWWVRTIARPGERPRLRFDYVAPLACRKGRFVLAFPPALEPDPVTAEVRIRTRMPGVQAVVRAPGVEGAAGRVLRATAPARAGWEIVVEPSRPRDVVVSSSGGHRTAVAICRAPAPRWSPAGAARFVFVVDRSRSVGSAGLALERELARAFVEQAAGSARFDAIPFARTPSRLFGVARLGTREALAAFDEALVPAALANGSELAPALALAGRAAADVSHDEDEPGAQVAVVVLTDGALPEGTSGATLARALTATTGVAVLVVRPRDESPPNDSALAALRSVAREHGGVVRVTSGIPAASAALDALADLAAGGDWFDVDAVPTGRAASGRVAGSVGPGQGARAVLPGGLRAVRYVAAGRSSTASVGSTVVPASWLPPDGTTSSEWAAISPSAALLVTPVPPSADDSVPCGRLDKDVIRNTLALAYMPRARACYLNRPPGTSRALEGRVQLALGMDRGELVDARVESSTLGQPDVEACLRDAAYAVEIPRPSRCDAPSLARLSLVFRPRATTVDAGTHESDPLDVVLGPVDLGFDPRALLDAGSQPAR